MESDTENNDRYRSTVWFLAYIVAVFGTAAIAGLLIGLLGGSP